MLALLQFSYITQCGYRQGFCTLTQFEHWSTLDVHLSFKKIKMILKIQAIYAAGPYTFIYEYSSPRLGAK